MIFYIFGKPFAKVVAAHCESMDNVRLFLTKLDSTLLILSNGAILCSISFGVLS